MSFTRRVKKEGSIPEGSYQKHINVGQKRMILSIKTDEDGSITIYIGNREIYCIEAQLIKEDTGLFSEQGYLNKIRWDSLCSLDNEFKKGDDTIMIMKLLLTYIHDKHPEVKRMRFTDLSTKECDNGSKVNLAAMKYLTVGKTWYEDKFGAYLDEEGKVYFRTKEEKLHSLKQTSWDDLTSRFDIGKYMSIDRERLREMYESSSTWQEFFLSIQKEVGIANFCIQISPWFDKFTKAFLNLNYLSLVYILPVKSYLSYKNYDITRGGTRRRVRTLPFSS